MNSIRYEKLDWKASSTRKWSEFELKELIKYYQIQIDNLKKEKSYDKN